MKKVKCPYCNGTGQIEHEPYRPNPCALTWEEKHPASWLFKKKLPSIKALQKIVKRNNKKKRNQNEKDA